MTAFIEIGVAAKRLGHPLERVEAVVGDDEIVTLDSGRRLIPARMLPKVLERLRADRGEEFGL
jgi:hypothetical protein